MLRAGTIALLFGFACTTAMVSQAPLSVSPREKYDALAKSTQLDAEGQAPFHIRIEAQLFDLDGRPSEKATIEEWWASSKQYHIEIKSPSFQETTSSLHSSPAVALHRTDFLLRELLRQMVHPLTELGAESNMTVVENSHKVGGLDMHCLQLEARQSTAASQSYCLDANKVFRISTNQSEVLIRDRTGRFQGSSTSLKTSILYLNRPAVSGDVTALQTFDPSQSSLAEFAAAVAATTDTTADTVSRPAAVIAGRKLTGENPSYPVVARQQHRTGSVVLCGMIGTAGKFTSLDVLAGTDDELIKASLEAVRSWTFKPYLLDGKPTSVQTTVTLNFNTG